MPKYRDFSEMPGDELRALAHDLANPKEAMKRIRAEHKTRKFESLAAGVSRVET